MAYESVKDILIHTREFHRELAAVYERERDQVDNERFRMILGYMRSHEKSLEDLVAMTEERAASGILDTWFQYTLDAPCVAELSKLRISSDMSVSDLIEVAVRFDREVVEYYRMLADSSESAEVKEFFQNLLNLEERQEKAMVRDVEEVEQL